MTKANKVLALIPARLNSVRLPNKVVLLIEKIPIIIHVYRRALRAKKIDDLIICCDDRKIFNLAKRYGAKVMLTSMNSVDKLSDFGKNARKHIIDNFNIDIQKSKLAEIYRSVKQ